MDVAVKTIMKKNIPKTQGLLKKEIDILRVIIIWSITSGISKLLLFYMSNHQIIIF